MNRLRAGASGSRLVRELLVVVALKLAMLYGLWFAFFRQPVDRTLSAEDVSRSFLNQSDSGGQAAAGHNLSLLKRDGSP